jgi:aldehyde:ferredoxin oxidoreductase
MAMRNGWLRKVLWVDLATGRIETAELDTALCTQFLGTYGIAARLLYDRIPAGADPLGPDNVLGLTAGPVARTSLPCTSRFVAVGKSPLTGTWGEANSGGSFGVALRGAGYDAVFFGGLSERPVYLFLTGERVELRPADDYWGLDAAETDDRLRAACGIPGAQVACIGPAGERLSRISGIVTDKGRIAARSGLGAVMGAKGLKAVVAGGSMRVGIADPDAFSELRGTVLARIHDPDNARIAGMQVYGTAGGMPGAILTNHCPIKNWKGVGLRDYPNPEALDGDRIIAGKTGQYRCGGCAIGCGAILRVDVDGRTVEMHRPEYETLSAFGPLLLVDDLDTILQANHRCNLAGLDTISAGTAIAFAMECFEQGLLTLSDTDGIDLHWGNAEAVLAVLDRMIAREGIGDLLADGVGSAARRIGAGAARYAMAVEGEALPMCDPRGTPGWATTYTTDATPARHMQGGSALPEFGMGPAQYIGVPEHGPIDKYDYGSKGPIAAETVKLMHVVNCSGICAFAPLTFDELRRTLGALTGHAYAYEELLTVGERVAVVRQAFNLREGFGPAFALPERVRGNPPLDEGPTAGVAIDLERQNRAFYRAMRWNPESGLPDPARVRALGGLDDVARHLARRSGEG